MSHFLIFPLLHWFLRTAPYDGRLPRWSTYDSSFSTLRNLCSLVLAPHSDTDARDAAWHTDGERPNLWDRNQTLLTVGFA